MYVHFPAKRGSINSSPTDGWHWAKGREYNTQQGHKLKNTNEDGFNYGFSLVTDTHMNSEYQRKCQSIFDLNH